jgi:AraC-like DNA-binding protein
LLIRRYHHYPVYYFAEKLGMTSAELNNKCKLHSGISAAEWISQYVLLEAKDLLIKTRLRSSRIAMMLNFSNYDTFARWFRRHTGELPGNWR